MFLDVRLFKMTHNILAAWRRSGLGRKALSIGSDTSKTIFVFANLYFFSKIQNGFAERGAENFNYLQPRSFAKLSVIYSRNRVILVQNPIKSF